MPFDTVTSDSVEFQAYQDYFGKPIDTNEGLIGETILMNCKTTGNDKINWHIKTFWILGNLFENEDGGKVVKVVWSIL